MRAMIVLMAVAGVACALVGSVQAKTIHQIKHNADGSSAIFTLSDEGMPQAGAVAIGNLDPQASTDQRERHACFDMVTARGL